MNGWQQGLLLLLLSPLLGWLGGQRVNSVSAARWQLQLLNVTHLTH